MCMIHTQTPPSVFLILKGRGVYFLRTLKDVTMEIAWVQSKIDSFRSLLAFLEDERELLLEKEEAERALAEMVTKRTIDKAMKND